MQVRFDDHRPDSAPLTEEQDDFDPQSHCADSFMMDVQLSEVWDGQNETSAAGGPPSSSLRSGGPCVSISLGRMSIMEGRLARASLRGRPQYHCLELWRASRELLKLPKEERMERAMKELLVSHDGPFPPDALSGVSPVFCCDRIIVQSVLVALLAGPVVFVFFPVFALVFWSWRLLVGWALVSLVLAFHPLPHRYLYDHRITLAFYRYFSFRLAWTDDLMTGALQDVNAWCGLAVPHGVFPISSLCGGFATNAFMQGQMIAGTASIVHRLPFLRYIAAFGPSCDVSAKTIRRHINEGHCVGLVADGIAGIFCKPHEVVLKTRKGLAKLSLTQGVPILTSYSFGNTEVYSVGQDPCGVLKWISRKTKVSVFLWWGSFGPCPRRRRLSVSLGPLVTPPRIAGDKPSQAEIDAMHERLLASVEAAVNNHKVALGYQDLSLKWI